MMKLFLVGGFLGSGKTTAIATAARILATDTAVAVITNDQGSRLVDSAFIDSLSVPGKEIVNGCFCCNYEAFYAAILDLKKWIRPKIVFAEAVGSCTDLVATIVNPLARFDTELEIALSVFADGPVLLSLLQGRSSFASDEIRYIYKKQLEEAGIIIINKSDLLTGEEIGRIQSLLESDYQGKKLLFQDARNEKSVEAWLDAMEQKSLRGTFKAPDLDYDQYGAGEAALAWLDASLEVHATAAAVTKSFKLIDAMLDEVSHQKLAIGHLKFFLQSGNWTTKISYTASHSRERKVSNEQMVANHANLIVNARVETSPEQLKKIFYQAIKRIESENSQIDVLDVASFQPAYPKPTYRFRE